MRAKLKVIILINRLKYGKVISLGQNEAIHASMLLRYKCV